MERATNENRHKPIFEALEPRLLLSASITGQKFEDLNANGVFDVGEPGLADGKIYLDLDANGQWDPGEPFDLTDSLGEYEITGLEPGAYTLAEELQSGWGQTLPSWGGIERVSVNSDGTQGNYDSISPSLSADGRYVAFESDSNNFVPGDTNSRADIFVHDRQTGLIERVSVDSAGIQVDGGGYDPSISADGRYVAFESRSTQLVPGDTNGAYDIFVHDRQTGLIERVSVDSVGAQANDNSYDPSIGADGRYVAFQSEASNLAADDTMLRDIFVHDRQTGLTERVSVDSTGAQGDNYSYRPSISADGRYVAFESGSSNLAADDTNKRNDIFVHDRHTGLVELVSADSTGVQGSDHSYSPSISADGRYVAFASKGTNLVTGDTNGDMDCFVHDRQTGLTERVSIDSTGLQANNGSGAASISANGRYVAFASDASNLAAIDTNTMKDVFVHDRQTGLTECVSVSSAGAQGNSDAYYFSSISADGRYVGFGSYASNLVDGDTNNDRDIFVAGATPGTRLPGRYSVTLAPDQTVGDMDFGGYRLKSISGLKFEDLDADGVKDPGEPGLDGWIIELVNPVTGEVLDTQTTAGGGLYSFDSVFSGNYILREIQQSGWIASLPDAAGHLVSIAPGQTLSGIYFGNYRLNSITGQKFEDLDANGHKDPGELGLDGWTIELIDSSTGLVLDAQVTAGGGTYLFAPVVRGDYELRETPQVGWMQTNLNPMVSLVSGDVITGQDFGNYQAASISGMKFEDLNGDGVKDAGEEGLDGWTIELVDRSTLQVVAAQTTSDGGLYAFAGLLSGDYEVRELLQDGWIQTLPAGPAYSMILAYNEDRGGVDFGNQPLPSEIRGRKFEDMNGNGVFDAGEPGLPGWKIYLDLDVNGRWEVGEPFDLTDAQGEYELTGLYYGSYVLAEELQSGWRQSSPAWEGIERVSVDSAGTEGNSDSLYRPSISADGRYVAFRSNASNLVVGDTNNAWDIFVHDRQSGLTERVNIDSAGAEVNVDSSDPSISADGRYVAFRSYASNLVAGDTNGYADVFVHDRQTGLTERVSVSSAGTQGDEESVGPSISADGRYVAFWSRASNLVADDTNGHYDIFVHDRQTGQTQRVSVDSTGAQSNDSSHSLSISADGRYVAFTSDASNLVAADTNEERDVFVHDRLTGQTERVSVDSMGVQADYRSHNSRISADGRCVVFESGASNLVAGDTNDAWDIFVHDRQTGLTERVNINSAGEPSSGIDSYPSISGDGRYVAFKSDARNLAADDTNGDADIFVHDRQTGVTERVGANSVGNQGNDDSLYPSISADGRYVAFGSDASNLVPGDTNNRKDIFIAGAVPATRFPGTYALTLAPGETVDDMNFGVYRPASISGQKFEDLNADGVKDVGESGLDGWTIELVDSSTGDVIRTRVTASGGMYSFADVVPGDYELRQVLQDGWMQIHPGPAAYSLAAVSGDALNGMDFASYQGASVSGMKFEDLNGDGVQDAGEEGLDGWTIELADPSTGQVVQTQVTAADGTYLFADIIAGDYEVREVLQADWAQTLPAAGAYSITLAYDEDIAGVDFGNQLLPGDIRGRKFEDLNANGVFDTGEPGLEGWRIYLDMDSNEQWDVGEPFDVTDALGEYEITGLAPGVYVLAEERQIGWTQSLPALGGIERVSVNSTGVQGNDGSYNVSISTDGRYVAFASDATNLAGLNTNNRRDTFVHDRQTGLTEQVSLGLGGAQANGGSYDPSISADGRYVAFEAGASNLVEGDTNMQRDIFVFDRRLDVTRRVSVDSEGGQANEWSWDPSISADGRYVAFRSRASNLVPDDTNDCIDIFVHDLQSGQTIRVSVDSAGVEGDKASSFPDISADGRYATFSSIATNLTVSDTNDDSDVFVHDLQTHETQRISVGLLGVPGNGDSSFPSISGDGRYVAYMSTASNLVTGDSNNNRDIFVYDRQTQQTQRVSVRSSGTQGNGNCYDPSISDDGRHVAFISYAKNLVDADTNNDLDAFVHDRQTGVTERLSVSPTGIQANGYSYAPIISGDGQYVTFHSEASNLVADDTNGERDVFVANTASVGRLSGTYDVTLAPGETAGGMDFGNYRVASISGQKFEDLDADGVKDPGESGLDGWFIELVDPSTQRVIDTQATAGGGFYSFTGLVLGDYNVREVLQTGWVQSLPVSGFYSIALGYGQNVDGIDFGNHAARGEITGLKFEDINTNGVYDAGEPSLDGWTIELVDASTGQIIQTQVTAEGGIYTFADIVPGEYEVRELLQSGWAQTCPVAAIYSLSVFSSDVIANIDFGNTRIGSIGGREFEDLNGDGIQDAGEEGLGGWTIELTDASTGQIIQTQVTAEGGIYAFTDIVPGEYEVRELLQSGWAQTRPAAAIYSLSVFSGDVIADIDFGNAQLGSIGGLKFEDLNGDGIQDAGEPGLKGWTIELVDGDTGLAVGVQVTSADGSYSFGDLMFGDYELRETPQHGWLRTLPAALVHSITLAYNEDRGGVDFAGQLIPGIYGRKFDDLNANGIQDPGEFGMDGWTIELVNPDNGAVMETAITASIDLDGSGDIDPAAERGLYSFTGLLREPGPSTGTLIVDNSDSSGFSADSKSRWRTTSGLIGAYNGDAKRGNYDNGRAWWVFEDLPTGLYRVWTSWGHSESKPSAFEVPYNVYEGGTIPGSSYSGGTLKQEFVVDQTVMPSDLQADGIWWRSLGAHSVSGQLVVEIQGPQNVPEGETCFAFADAVRIESGLPSYFVREVAQAGWTQTSPASGEHAVFVQPGGSSLNINFGNHDVVAPIITVDTLTTDDASPALSGTVDDPGADVEVAVDGKAYAASNNGDGTWTLDAGVIAPRLGEGIYDVIASAADPSGNIGVDLTTAELTVDIPSQIVGRRMFYNNSVWDGSDPAAGVSDDGAIAADKIALLPGGAASPANCSNYSRGINGIMVDVAGHPGGPVIGDFGFRVSDPAAPGEWIDGPVPALSVRAGEGVGGSDRVTLIWPDGAIVDRWVEVTVKSDANGGGLGLVDDDVFYFGSSVGDCDGDGAVDDRDYDTLASEFGRRGDGLLSDFNGDGRVGLSDFVIMRKRFGNTVVAPSFPVASPVAAAPVASAPVMAAASELELELGGLSGAGEALGSSVSSEGLRSLTDYWFTEVTSPVVNSDQSTVISSQLTAYGDGVAPRHVKAAPSRRTPNYGAAPARSAVRPQLAATSAYDLRPLSDDLVIDAPGQGDLLVDLLAESTLASSL
jgi:Tol biopolymer transport system component